MKLRGNNKIDKSKTIPFMLVAVFLIMLGLTLVAEGLLVEFKWKYHIEIYYKPHWLGALVMVAGCFVLVFCHLRIPTVGVIVTGVCIPALAGCIIMLVFSGLMADAISPRTDKYFCSSAKTGTSTLRCKCAERIEFDVTVKGNVLTSTTSHMCEDEMMLIFELMLVSAGVSGVLTILLFVYIFAVFCAATEPTYMERRCTPFNGTLTRSQTIARASGDYGTLVLSNNTLDMQVPKRSHTFQGFAQHAQLNSPRPVVTVQRESTWKSNRAPQPPLSARDIIDQHEYQTIEDDPIRIADQRRFEIPTDIHKYSSTPLKTQGTDLITLSQPPQFKVQAATTSLSDVRHRQYSDTSTDDNTAVTADRIRSFKTDRFSAVDKVQNYTIVT